MQTWLDRKELANEKKIDQLYATGKVSTWGLLSMKYAQVSRRSYESKMLNLSDQVLAITLNEINELPDKDKECVYSLLDAFLAKSKLQAILK